MSIRRTIILFTVPLFLLLAIVNGALLYFQEKAEMSQALGEQALAAAVSAGEFIASMDRPLEELADTLRAKALHDAAEQVAGLDGLYFIAPGASPHALIAATHPWALDRLARPALAAAGDVLTDAAGRPYVVALAPTPGGGFVAARIDAQPMFDRMAAIQQAIMLIVGVAGLTAAGLSWFVARRIERELERNRQAIAAIAAGEPVPSRDDLSIREARDLADAVQLMEASRQAAAVRSRRVAARRDRERTLDDALVAKRDMQFPALAQRVGGCDVAMRMCGKAPLGCFFALGQRDGSAMIVLGRCAAPTPRDALAQAVAARAFVEAHLSTMPPEDLLAALRAAHDIAELDHFAWAADHPSTGANALLAIAEPATVALARNYAAQNRDVAPAAVLDGIELLLAPDGVFAAVKRG